MPSLTRTPNDAILMHHLKIIPSRPVQHPFETAVCCIIAKSRSTITSNPLVWFNICSLWQLAGIENGDGDKSGEIRAEKFGNNISHFFYVTTILFVYVLGEENPTFVYTFASRSLNDSIKLHACTPRELRVNSLARRISGDLKLEPPKASTSSVFVTVKVLTDENKWRQFAGGRNALWNERQQDVSFL